MARRVGEVFLLVSLLALLLGILAVAVYGPVTAEPRLFFSIGIATSLAWLLGVCLVFAGNGNARHVVAGAIALRLLALVATPGLSDDLHRYAWEGELLTRGTSPYAFAPDSPELADLRTEFADVFAGMNNKDISAAYPPLALAPMAAVSWLAGLGVDEPEQTGSTGQAGHTGWRTVRGLRIFFALCDLLVLWPLIVLLRRHGMPEGLAMIWGWCPVIVLEFGGSGHFDSLGVLLLISALCILDGRRSGRSSTRSNPGAGLDLAELGRGALALALLTGSILVKILPLCAVPFAVRGGFAQVTRRLLWMVVLTVLAFLPWLFLKGGTTGMLSGLSEYGLRWEWNSLVYRFVEPVFAFALERDGSWSDPRRLGRILVVLVWLAWGGLCWRRGYGPLRATGAMIGAFIVLSPTLHPWYLAWVVPFVVLRPVASWIWLLAVAPLTYWPLVTGGPEPVWMWPSIAILFFLLLIYEARSDHVVGGRRLAVDYAH